MQFTDLGCVLGGLDMQGVGVMSYLIVPGPSRPLGKQAELWAGK